MKITFDIDQLEQRQAYKLLASTVVPRPIAWVLTKNNNNVINLAPFSFFNVFSGHPPVICIGIGNRDSRSKDTRNNIEANGEFIVHMVNDTLAAAMNQSSAHYPPDISEVDALGLETQSAHKLKLPLLKDSPVAIECKLKQIIDIEPTGIMVVATVTAIHIAEEAILDKERCYIDSNKLQLIGRMASPGWYVRTTDTFQLSSLLNAKIA